jgi:hypothetical protein
MPIPRGSRTPASPSQDHAMPKRSTAERARENMEIAKAAERSYQRQIALSRDPQRTERLKSRLDLTRRQVEMYRVLMKID